jgi:hypothetical protein
MPPTSRAMFHAFPCLIHMPPCLAEVCDTPYYTCPPSPSLLHTGDQLPSKGRMHAGPTPGTNKDQLPVITTLTQGATHRSRQTSSPAAAAVPADAPPQAKGSRRAASQDAAENSRRPALDDATAAGAAAGRGNTPADEVMQMYRRSTVNNI